MHFTKPKSSSRMKNRNEDNIVRFRSKEMLPQYNALKNVIIQSCSHFNYVFSSIKMRFFNVSFISIPFRIRLLFCGFIGLCFFT